MAGRHLSSKTRKAYNKWWYDRQQQMAGTCVAPVDFVPVATDEDYVRALMGLFKNRASI